jgi:hypothetical protein
MRTRKTNEAKQCLNTAIGSLGKMIGNLYSWIAYAYRSELFMEDRTYELTYLNCGRALKWKTVNNNYSQLLCCFCLFNKHLSKPNNSEKFLGANGAQNRDVLDVHKASSTGATQKLPEEQRLRKRSNGVIAADKIGRRTESIKYMKQSPSVANMGTISPLSRLLFFYCVIAVAVQFISVILLQYQEIQNKVLPFSK